MRGIEEGPVTEWFAAQVEGCEPPLAFELIAGGHSNLTYGVTDAADRRYVLRRPPLHHVLPTAHDMGREHRIISAVGPTPVPVPDALGYCEDPTVNGAPFYVMSFVDGYVFHDDIVAGKVLDDDGRRRTGEHFIDVLADLHAVDVDAVGLGDLARKDGYIERQLKRWYSQWEQSKTREVPAVDLVHFELLARVPAQPRVSIVHGDYRLGNCLTSEEGRIAAVLDWEICTLGDPLADVGYVLSTFARPNAPGALPGFPSLDELLDRYAARSGLDVSGIKYYIAFSYWKSACIVEGVYARYLGGALGESEVDFAAFKNQVETVAAMAEQALAAI